MLLAVSVPAVLVAQFQQMTPLADKVELLGALPANSQAPVLVSDQQAYWRARAAAVTLVQPAELLLPSFSLMALPLALAAALATAVERQFQGVIRPLLSQPNAEQLPDLGGWAIRELQLLVELVNRRTHRTRELSSSLQQARDERAQTALAITDAIPVGTYTMVLRPWAELAQFSFLSEYLQIFGPQREAAEANPLNAFACVHPDDYDGWLALNTLTFEQKLRFKGQCRVVVNGQVRWIPAESVPRDLADGSTVWEGVISDITEQLEPRCRCVCPPWPEGNGWLAVSPRCQFQCSGAGSTCSWVPSRPSTVTALPGGRACPSSRLMAAQLWPCQRTRPSLPP